MRVMAWASVAVWTAISILTAPVPARAQEEQRTVWDGVFTAGQASNGAALFDLHCNGCHGSGRTSTSVVAMGEDAFLTNWGEDVLISLYDRIRTTMPASAPASLSAAIYTDIVAYVLESNGFPAGDGLLAPDMMASVRVESRDGPGEVPDFSLVEVRGCLSEDAGRWIVTQGTDLVRTRDPLVSSAERLAELAGRSLGSATYELVYVYPAPTAQVGHVIEAKGFLIRDADPDQINVSSLATVTETCSAG